jgi:uncharacterized membrane protein
MARRIEIKPNQSLTRRGAIWFFVGMSIICLGIAGAFASLGLWPVLPFAGAELALLGVALMLSLRASGRRELIHIDAERVVIERRPADKRGPAEFSRPWVRVDLQTSARRNHPSRLVLRQRERICEVGRCLTDQERATLRARLQQILKTP